MAEGTREIVHDEENRRFTCAVDGHVTYCAYQRVDERTVDFTSTYTPPAVRGRGIAARVVERALEWAQANDLRVHASCWFVAEYLERNPRFASLTAS